MEFRPPSIAVGNKSSSSNNTPSATASPDLRNKRRRHSLTTADTLKKIEAIQKAKQSSGDLSDSSASASVTDDIRSASAPRKGQAADGDGGRMKRPDKVGESKLTSSSAKTRSRVPMLNLPPAVASATSTHSKAVNREGSSGSGLDGGASAPSTQRATPRGINDHHSSAATAAATAGLSAYRRPSYESAEPDHSRPAMRDSEVLVSQPAKITPRGGYPSDTAVEASHHHGSQVSAHPPRRPHDPALQLASTRKATEESTAHRHRSSEEPTVETVYAPRRQSNRADEMASSRHTTHSSEPQQHASRRSSESVVHSVVQQIETSSSRRKLDAEVPVVSKSRKKESNKSGQSRK